MAEIPALDPTKPYYAVIDVEALVLGSVINVVEQIAFVLYDIDGTEAWSEKHIIFQPHGVADLSKMYGVPRQTVQRSVDAYTRITGDANPVHSNPRIHPKWCHIRRHILKACRDHAAAVYAKGTQLENSVFYGTINFLDLAWWGCPKYPLAVHDPLLECRFFAQFIPEIRMYSNMYYNC